MNRYLVVTENIHTDRRGREHPGALITTRHGRSFFIDHKELRAVSDDLHDIADNLDTQLEGTEQ